MTDAEIVHVEDPARAIAPTLFGTDEPAEVIRRATEHAKVLKDILVQRGHIVSISGGQHVKLEGWTTLGSQLGVFAVVTRTDPMPADWQERKMDAPDGWKAYAEARTLAGQVVGAADAICMRSEGNWRDRDDYARLSMAQTRACSKALRMPLGFIVELAGYNPTPAEEIIGVSAPASQPIQRSGTGRGGVGTGATSGVPPLPPLKMTPDMRNTDGTFPRRCPYCLSDVRRDTVTTKAGDEKTVWKCTLGVCQGGEPMRPARPGDTPSKRWAWSSWHDDPWRVGGEIDELVEHLAAPHVDVGRGDFDPKTFLRGALAVCSENWTQTRIQDEIRAAKRGVDPGGRWTQATTQQVALAVLEEYHTQYPDDEEALL